MFRFYSFCSSSNTWRLYHLLIGAGISIVIYQLHRIERRLKHIERLLLVQQQQQQQQDVSYSTIPNNNPTLTANATVSTLYSCHSAAGGSQTSCHSAAGGSQTSCHSSDNSCSLTFYDVAVAAATAAASGGAGAASAADDPQDQLLTSVDQLAVSDPAAALLVLDRAQEQQCDCDVEYVWRRVMLLKTSAALQPTVDKQKELLGQAISLAEQAIVIHPSSYQLHKWLALSAGARAQLLATARRLPDVQLFRDRLKMAAELAPQPDAMLHHALGRFYYEVACSSWLERMSASVLLTDLPDDCPSAAVQELRRADTLSHSVWPENTLFLARSLLLIGERSEARELLLNTRASGDTEPTEAAVWQQIDALLAEFSAQQQSEVEQNNLLATESQTPPQQQI